MYVGKISKDTNCELVGHYSGFRAGGETELNGRIYTNYASLLSNINTSNPLTRGIHRGGFIAFVFEDAPLINDSNQTVKVENLELSLIDSFGQTHQTTMISAEIYAGYCETGQFDPFFA